MERSFKERVRLALIKNATLYKELFIETEYLIYSNSFEHRKFYILTGYEDNYLHLTGVETNLNATVFFEKCIDNSLKLDDFSFRDNAQKGSVRRKINVLEKALKMLCTDNLQVEEKFIKNRIHCAIASSDNVCTLGFTDSNICKPMTLLKGNELNNTIQLDAIFKKKKSDDKFNINVIIDETKKDEILQNLRELVM